MFPSSGGAGSLLSVHPESSDERRPASQSPNPQRHPGVQDWQGPASNRSRGLRRGLPLSGLCATVMIDCSLALICDSVCNLQGVSVAGAQRGLSDCRASLIREVFRVWDTLPRRPCSDTDFPARIVAHASQGLHIPRKREGHRQCAGEHAKAHEIHHRGRPCFMWLGVAMMLILLSGVWSSWFAVALGHGAHAPPRPSCQALMFNSSLWLRSHSINSKARRGRVFFWACRPGFKPFQTRCLTQQFEFHLEDDVFRPGHGPPPTERVPGAGLQWQEPDSSRVLADPVHDRRAEASA